MKPTVLFLFDSPTYIRGKKSCRARVSACSIQTYRYRRHLSHVGNLVCRVQPRACSLGTPFLYQGETCCQVEPSPVLLPSSDIYAYASFPHGTNHTLSRERQGRKTLAREAKSPCFALSRHLLFKHATALFFQ